MFVTKPVRDKVNCDRKRLLVRRQTKFICLMILLKEDCAHDRSVVSPPQDFQSHMLRKKK